MKLSLVVVNAGKASGQTIQIKTPHFIIGRDPDCNLRPASAVISKKHCALIVKGGKVTLTDFESTNGTSLNDQPVKGEVAIANGDMLKVGPLTFRVLIEETPAPSKPTPLPKPAKVSEEDDAAALLLSLDDGTISTPDDAEGVDVPGGSTVMDIPSFTAQDATEGGKTPKPDNKKKEEKAKQHDSASSAAAALIDKMRKGVRK
jgi:pSer/pThr/pTyr-binding forkhead associated (FHA) protein